MTKTTKTLLTTSIRLNAVSLAFRKFEDHAAYRKELDLMQAATELVIKDLKKAATKRELDVLRNWGRTRLVDGWTVENLPIKVEGSGTQESVGLPMSLFKPQHADSRGNWKPNLPQQGHCMNMHYQNLYVVEACDRIKFGQQIEIPHQIGMHRYWGGDNTKIVNVFVRNGHYSANACDPSNGQAPATPFVWSEPTVKAVEEMVRHGHTRWHQKMQMMKAAIELIGKCKTLEELEAAWPEANVLRKDIVKNLPSPVLASDFNILLENMKQRGVKLAA